MATVLDALLAGLLFGFLGSIPIAGPASVVIVTLGLQRRRRFGMRIAVGAAAAEATYALVAFGSLAAVLSRFPHVVAASRAVACGLLAVLGVCIAVRGIKRQSFADPVARAGRHGELIGLAMTGLNPTILVSWTVAVGLAHTLGLVRPGIYAALAFAGGAGMGIVAWFALLLWLLERFRARVTPVALDVMVRGLGVALIVAGLGLGARLVAAGL